MSMLIATDYFLMKFVMEVNYVIQVCQNNYWTEIVTKLILPLLKLVDRGRFF